MKCQLLHLYRCKLLRAVCFPSIYIQKENTIKPTPMFPFTKGHGLNVGCNSLLRIEFNLIVSIYADNVKFKHKATIVE